MCVCLTSQSRKKSSCRSTSSQETSLYQHHRRQDQVVVKRQMVNLLEGVVPAVEAVVGVVGVVAEEEVVAAAVEMSKGIVHGMTSIRRAEGIMIGRGDTTRRWPGLVGRASFLACLVIFY